MLPPHEWWRWGQTRSGPGHGRRDLIHDRFIRRVRRLGERRLLCGCEDECLSEPPERVGIGMSRASLEIADRPRTHPRSLGKRLLREAGDLAVVPQHGTEGSVGRGEGDRRCTQGGDPFAVAALISTESVLLRW